MTSQELAIPNPQAQLLSSSEFKFWTSRSLQDAMLRTNASVQGICSLAERLGTIRDSDRLRTRLREYTDTARARVQRSWDRIQVIASHVPQSPETRKLVSEFDVSVRNFQAAQELSASRLRAHAVPALVLPGNPSGPLVDLSDATQTHLVYATDEASRAAQRAKRQAAIRELEEGIKAVAQIMRQLEDIFEREGTESMLQCNPDLEQGVEELGLGIARATRHQRCVNRMCLMIIVGVVVIGVVLVLR
ncbi:hypothetical protein DFH06DRAFT_1317231 [Mycena polygramma]|nr:hypothetical protein DFH06DRAFT_1317231 [Mycena polygramma]